MATGLELIRKFYPLHADRIVEEAGRQSGDKRLERPFATAAAALHVAFVWSDTKEREIYWHDLYKRGHDDGYGNPQHTVTDAQFQAYLIAREELRQ